MKVLLILLIILPTQVTSCPDTFFACANGECVSPRWRCDGHYDCDDFSDEVNCPTPDHRPLDIRPISIASVPAAPPAPAPLPPPAREEVVDIKFNSTVEPLMLISIGDSIRGYWMRQRVYFDVVSMGLRPAKPESPSITQALSIFFDLFNAQRSPIVPAVQESDYRSRSTIVGVDMEPNEKEVFWVELGKDPAVYSTVINSEHFDSRHRRQYNIPKTVINSGLLSPEDVALDILGKNIYITDAGLPAIVVCHYKRNDCKKLIEDGLHKPRAIIADSTTGWLTYTDWGDHPGIFLVSMDGKRRETLIDTDIVWPNGLAADYQANQLYWADARLSKIECIDLTTKKRREIIKEAAANPFSLSIFDNRIYWSDWSGSDIRTCDKNTGNDTKIIMRTENIYGIHIYHPSLHSNELANPCWSKQCSHLCLLSPTGKTYAERKSGSLTAQCACSDYMALSKVDHSTCFEFTFRFLLINIKNYVAQMFPERIGFNTIEKIVYSPDYIIHDVASDWAQYRLFFFDAAKQAIYKVDLRQERIQIEQFVSSNQSTRGMLYDGWSDNLYWLESERGTLTMCPVKGRFKTIIKDGIDLPVSMVLDSKNRVFYIAHLGSKPAIIRVDILGGNKTDLNIVKDDIGLPVALHLDPTHQRLYWADASRETIESIDLDIKAENGIVSHSRVLHRRNLGTILAFGVFNDTFIWSIKNGDYLHKAKMSEGEESKPVSFKLPANPSLKDPASDSARLLVVDPISDALTDDHPCEKRACSHGCVLDSNHDASCVCPPSYHLLPTSRNNCTRDEPVKPIKIIPHPVIAENSTLALVGDSKIIEQETLAPEERGNRMVWMIVLLLLLSVTGLLALVSLLILYRQGRLPRQVSQLSVSFIPQGRGDRDGAMLLLDGDN